MSNTAEKVHYAGQRITCSDGVAGTVTRRDGEFFYVLWDDSPESASEQGYSDWQVFPMQEVS